NTLATCQQRCGPKTETVQQIPDSQGGILDLAEGERFIRVQVEYKPVRLFKIVHPRAPDMELNGPHLGSRDKAGAIVDIEVGLDVAVPLLDGDFFQFVRESLAGMFLEEAVPGQTLRTTHEGQGTFAADSQQALSCRVVEGCQVDLRDARSGKDFPAAV